jgi:hypothetical protein
MLQEQIDQLIEFNNNNDLARQAQYRDVLAKVKDITDPVQEKLEILLLARARWHSDDLLRQGKIVQRFDSIMNDYQDLRNYIEVTISPLVTCLLES